MKLFESKHFIALLGVLALVCSGCASDGSQPTDQQFEAPHTVAPGPEMNLFSQALKAQNEGQFESAIKLWKSFLSKHPESFEGHNNLGLVYYTQDMLSQSLQEFETAYRLEPVDPRIRKNLARALRFKASMLHENREYFKTLEILARLELIVEPEEKQAILFKQEQVEDQIYLQVIKADNSAAYQDFINRFPDGLNAVRAREYLEEHPHTVSKSTSTTQTKSWISSGKAVTNPGGDPGGSSWASSAQPPQYGSSRPTATYTPPPAGASKKTGDFFGSDSAAVEDSPDKGVTTSQAINPVAAIPFEDFEKPERSSGEQVASKIPFASKESRRIADEFNPIRDEPDTGSAGLDTLPDLTPVEVAALPEEMDAPQSTDSSAGAIEQPAMQDSTKAATASVEASVEQANEEEAKPEEPEMAQAESVEPEPAQPEPVQEMPAEQQTVPVEKAMEASGINQAVESAVQESVESESERIARIVKEEIARAENALPESAQVAEQEDPQEESLEVARLEPEAQAAPAENAPVEEVPSTPDAEDKQTTNQQMLSETVAALIPSPPPVEAMGPAVDSMDASNTMVVVEMRPGATLNVRANPSTQGEILGYLENGDMMPLMSESGDWYQIEIEKGLSGWVSKEYSTLRNVAPVAALPVPEAEMSSELSSLQPEPQQSSEAMVLVTVGEESTLNVRSIPSAGGAVVDMLFGGDKLPYVKEEGEWYEVRFEDQTTGWISKKFSVLEGSAPAAPVKASVPEPRKKTADRKASDKMVTTVVVIKVPEGSALNVRSTPSSQGQVMGSLQRGDMRPLLEETDEWYQVELSDGQSGWVSQKFSGKMNVDPSFVENP